MRILLFFTLMIQFILSLSSQQNYNYVTPGGLMDTVFDRFGNKYPVSALKIDEGDGRHGITTAMPTCTAGMFVVYFGMGSGMESLTIPSHAMRRNIVCEVLSNISGLLGYNSNYPAAGMVRMLVDDVSGFTSPNSPSQSGVLGIASGYYVGLVNSSIFNPGIIENLIHKTIRTKSDAWDDVIGPVATIPQGNFYHGVIAFNFSNPAMVWNHNSNLLPTSGQYDLYTVMLHEITHSLGFASLIGYDGNSVMGFGNNYYSHYDKFLKYRTSPTTLSPLLTSTACNAQYGLSFSTNSVVLNPSCASFYLSDVTTCTSSIVYSSPNLSFMPVYTPDCYEPGSSLSHFEDMCFPTNNANNNNMYFTMSNGLGAGVCKRHLTEEERKVLCDLDYNVSATYTSNAQNASYTYTSAACNQAKLVGKNDGIINGVYTYSSSGGPIIIPISGSSGILTNDYGFSAIVSTLTCLELAIGNGNIQINASQIIFTPSTAGLHVLRYIPKSPNGLEGNVTLIYCFVFPSFCGSSSPCDMVQNGGFEINSGCGSMPVGTNTNASCWLRGSLSPDLYVRNCVNFVMPADLGNNTCNSTPVLDSYSGSPNNAIIGVGGLLGKTQLAFNESFVNYLGTPIVNGGVYNLSFWAYQFIGTKTDPDHYAPQMQTFNADSVPVVVSFAVRPNFVYSPNYDYNPHAAEVVGSVQLNNTFNQWVHYSFTFTATNSNSGIWLHTGMDGQLTNQVYLNKFGQVPPYGYLFYTLFDEISIKQAQLSTAIKIPDQICSGQSYMNLENYVTIPGGVFSGTGITSSTLVTSNGVATQYHFNALQNLPNGSYLISYNYTNSINCSNTALLQITIGSINSGIQLSSKNSTTCVNVSTISVASPSIGFSYTLMPGSIVGTTYNVLPTAPTNYTVLATNGGTCSYMGSIRIVPPSSWVKISSDKPFLCPGESFKLTANGTFNTATWSPSGTVSNSITINTPPSQIISVNVTAQNGCTAQASFSVKIGVNPTVSISYSPPFFCAGNPVFLNGYGAPSYEWNSVPSGSNFIVNPVVSTVVKLKGVNLYGCGGTATVLLVPYTTSINAYPTKTICAGETVTLTGQNGANSYHWPPYPVYSQQFAVTPLQSTMYKMKIAKFFPNNISCSTEDSVYIKVNACLSNANHENGSTIQLFPNPNNGTFYIKYLRQTHNEVSIINEAGQIVKQLQYDGTDTNPIEITGINPGFYIVAIGNERHKLIVVNGN